MYSTATIILFKNLNSKWQKLISIEPSQSNNSNTFWFNIICL